MKVEHADEQMRIFRAGLDQPILTQHARYDKRPFIHPILAPDGIGELTEDEPEHHPWQHGLYTGLNDLNGVGFWTEGRIEKYKEQDGTFHPRPLEPPNCGENSVGWKVSTEWRSPSGEPMLNETQRWDFRDCQTEFVLDLTWTLRVLTDMVFGQYAYGGLFLRMPYRREIGGRAVNSQGEGHPEAEAKRSRWVALEMPIPGREECRKPVCSIAMLDHPSNPEHPVPWRVDGDLGVAPSRCIAGAWKLGAGESSQCRYRLLIGCGALDPKPIEEAWKHFADA